MRNEWITSTFSSRAELKAVGDDDSGEFEGYGSVFGIVDKAAFVESLKDFRLPKLQLQHSPYMVSGVCLEAREDEKGL